jgi:uncharacterized membrane protein
MTNTNSPSAHPTFDRLPAPRRVAFDAPWKWLAAGWMDIRRAPRISITYGVAAVVGAGIIVLGLSNLQAVSLFLALAGGFLLVGPLLAVGLYETSRRHARGLPVRLADIASVPYRARGQLAFFGAMLLFAFMVWLQLGFLLFMLFLGGSGLPPPSAFMQELLFTPRGLGLLIVGTLIGGTIATLVFAISALAVPMLMMRQTDAVTAARASYAAVVMNWQPMALWAALIAAIMAAGFAMLLVGLAIAFPLIGHATWHAYADVYGETGEG